MDLGQIIDIIAWEMENGVFGKKNGHEKYSIKSIEEPYYLLISLPLCTIILILCSQIKSMDLFFRVKYKYSCEESAFYILMISALIMIIPMIVAANISNIVLNKALSKIYIYNQLNMVYDSRIQPLIDKMKDNDVDQIDKGMKWVAKLFPKAVIDAVSFSCVFLIFDKIIIEVWTTFKIVDSDFVYIVGNVVLTGLLLMEVVMFCGALLIIKENIYSNQAIIKEYLVEKWKESNKGY